VTAGEDEVPVGAEPALPAEPAAPAEAPAHRLHLPGRVLARMAARTPLLQATWNYERHQGTGWAYCIQPALDHLYPEPRLRAERLAEHTGYFNTQPTLASLALGAVASLEEARARTDGVALGPTEIGRVKAALGSALAAVGDALFWSTLRPVAACLGVIVAFELEAWGALVMLALYNAFHLTLRLRGVTMGYRLGPAVLSHGLRESLQRSARVLAALGAGLCGVLAAALLVRVGGPPNLGVQAALAAGMVSGLLTATRPRPSATQWALIGGAICIVLAWR
jgi:mannose/fructose/N-acetylgalactosamine-specific phosphotransferase system component IID